MARIIHALHCLGLALLLAQPALAASAPTEIPLWGTATPPGSQGIRLTEQANNRSSDSQRPNREISQVGQPSLTAFIPEHPNGTAVIIAPGGSYTKLAFDKEGVEIARWLNSQNITAFVLKYRLPNEGHQNGRLVPLQDGQRAVRLLRANAAQWHLNPGRIGIMGFSAGGHLAAATAYSHAQEAYTPIDAVDSQSARPDFVVLLYAAAAFSAQTAPAGDSTEANLAYRASGALEAVKPGAPPTFMMIAEDDRYRLADMNVALWQALHRAKVPVEMHIALTGGHGFALQESAAASVKTWPGLLIVWLKAIGMSQP